MNANKLTPLHSRAEKLGAQFAELDGWRVPDVFSNNEEDHAAARGGVVAADESPNGKLYVEGNDAELVIRTTFRLSDLKAGEGTATHSVYVYRLRQNQYFVSIPFGAETDVKENLLATTRESGKFVTLTDMTDGLAEIRIIGPASRDLLSKLCGLDFDSAKFPIHAAQQSSVAKIKQLILRRDIGGLPAFSLIGAASSAVYLWNTIMETGQEWHVRPVGLAAIKNLVTT